MKMNLTEATMLALKGELNKEKKTEDNRITSKNGYDLTGDADGYKVTKNGKFIKSFGGVDKETAIMEFDEFIENGAEDNIQNMPDRYTASLDIHINLDKLGENFTDNAKQILLDLVTELVNKEGLIGGKKELKYNNEIVGYYNCDTLS